MCVLRESLLHLLFLRKRRDLGKLQAAVLFHQHFKPSALTLLRKELGFTEKRVEKSEEHKPVSFQPRLCKEGVCGKRPAAFALAAARARFPRAPRRLQGLLLRVLPEPCGARW